LELGEITTGQPKTNLRYLHDMYAQESHGKVIRVVPEKRTHIYLILDGTIFHPKGGGQPSDRGTIRGDQYEVTVKKAIQYKGVVVHWAKLNQGTPIEGEAACVLDWRYRFLVTRRHTAAHLLDHCLAQSMGTKVQTTDSWLDEPCYVGYAGKPPSQETLRSAEGLANHMIEEGRKVRIDFLSSEEARDMLRNAPNYERLPELSEVRTVTIDGCEPIPCGGTHVGNLTDIGGISGLRAEPLLDSYRLHFSVIEKLSSSS